LVRDRETTTGKKRDCPQVSLPFFALSRAEMSSFAQGGARERTLVRDRETTTGKARDFPRINAKKSGTPDEIRTHDLLLRRDKKPPQSHPFELKRSSQNIKNQGLFAT